MVLSQDELQDRPSVPKLIGTYKIPLILGSVSVFTVILAVLLMLGVFTRLQPIEFSHDGVVSGVSSLNSLNASASGSGLLGQSILVDVEGAVKKPGVYAFPVGSRVEDAIQKAGGLSRDADEIAIARQINRAMKVVDGMKLYVPKLQDVTSHNGDNNDVKSETSHNVDSLLQRPDGLPQNDGGISINFASQSDLEALPGVGPVTAAKIIAGRPYGTVDDLVKKKIVGQSVFGKIKNLVTP